MNVKYKEDPRAWCKSTLFTVLALLVLTSILRWRHFLTNGVWGSMLLTLVALIAPFGILLRLIGKDPLRLKRSPHSTSYWRPARQGGSLDRSF
jgi:hypothetical protein